RNVGSDFAGLGSTCRESDCHVGPRDLPLGYATCSARRDEKKRYVACRRVHSRRSGSERAQSRWAAASVSRSAASQRCEDLLVVGGKSMSAIPSSLRSARRVLLAAIAI